jgi:DHA1 family bicyclomycin/chloramphenicol resistance-like MFS transporter
MKPTVLRMALVLGLVSAIGPFAIDMYLPALPSIGASLGADLHTVQTSLAAFILTMSVTQLFYGPLSDRIGLKTPLYIGILLFGCASIGCAFAPDIGVLIAFRALQGIGAGAGTVIPRAIVRDLHTGPEAVRLMSLLMLVFSVSPILAPLTGSFVVALASWRGIFWVVTAAAALGGLLVATQLPETRPVAARSASGLTDVLASYRLLLRDRAFLGLSLIGAFGISAFLVYLANSSFVIIDHYGLSPALYSLCFAANAAAFIGAAQFNGRLTRRFGLLPLMAWAAWGFMLVMLALFVIMAAGSDRLSVMAVLLFIGYSFLGVMLPNATVLALERHGAIAGTASALLGTVQMTGATLVMGGAGIFANGKPLAMVGGIAACALAAFGLVRWILREQALYGTVVAASGQNGKGAVPAPAARP